MKRHFDGEFSETGLTVVSQNTVHAVTNPLYVVILTSQSIKNDDILAYLFYLSATLIIPNAPNVSFRFKTSLTSFRSLCEVFLLRLLKDEGFAI